MTDKAAKPAGKSLRHRSRELAVQGIYQWRMGGTEPREIEKSVRDEKSLGRYDAALYTLLLHGVVEHHQSLVTALEPHMERSLKELSPIEFSILLLGAFELIHNLEVPYRVVINESVELAKTFGGTDGHKFVNGVLDKLAAVARSMEVNAG